MASTVAHAAVLKEKPRDGVVKTRYYGIAAQYAQYGIKNTVYLAYRDVPMLMAEFLNVDLSSQYNVLDFGCGTGTSTRLIKRISPSAKVEGVDIDTDMMQFAIKRDPKGIYTKIHSHVLPHKAQSFDFIFSSFAFLDMPSKKMMKEVLSEIRRVLKEDGVFVLVTASPEMFNQKHQWLSIDNRFPENIDLSSGKVAKVMVKETNILFYDYYWTEKDYSDVFKQAGLRLALKHLPLGSKDDKVTWDWKSEADVSPFMIFVLHKA